MKKLLLAMVCAAMFTACSSNIEKLEDFVNDTEKNCEDFTAEDWKENAEEFSKLMEAISEDEESLTEEEQKQRMKLTVKYTTISAKKIGKRIFGDK